MPEAKERLAKFPDFPYDGQNSDTFRASVFERGGPQILIDEARALLASKGIDIPSKW